VRAPSTARPARALLRAALAWTLAAGPPAGTAAAADDNRLLEYEVKATYLYKFAPFVQWPSSAFDSPSSPLQLCVAATEAVGDVVERAAAGQSAGEHPVAVRRVPAAARVSGCHILYLAGTRAASTAAALDAVRGTPVLTVTDGAGERDPHGVVNFVIRENRVRFQIDNQEAAENSLLISSKLLSLADYVWPRLEAAPAGAGR